MQSPLLSLSDTLIRQSRRSLWTACVLILFIGAFGALQLLAPASLAARTMAYLLPLMIVIAVVSQPRRALPDAASMRIVLDDELRQAALSLAWRNGFLTLLVMQPLLAWALTVEDAPHPVALMALVTALAGALAFLGSFLYFDR